MIIVVEGTKTFDDYEIFMRAMGVALSKKDIDNDIQIWSLGPHTINSFTAAFCNISEKFLKNKGYKLIAISGSSEDIVGRIATNYGFDLWVGSKYEKDISGFTGNNFVASSNKKEILSGIIKEHNLSMKGSYAVGDTANDASILEMVENPIAFNPNKALYDIARSKGWKIVIERKNVSYELTSTNDGTYTLN